MFLVQAPSSPPRPRDWTQDLERAKKILRGCDYLLIVAGAGMSCDSDLPDYRSAAGFWQSYPPLLAAGVSLQEMSQSDWFTSDPTLAWGFYSHRQQLYSSAEPHSGYLTLLQLAHGLPRSSLGVSPFFVMTSNVDSLFHKAGFPPNRICETHGSLAFRQCTSNCIGGQVWSAESSDSPLLVDPLTLRLAKGEAALPRCHACDQLARPNVSFFTDTADTFCNSRQVKQKGRLLDWLEAVEAEKDSNLAILEVGCGTSIHSLRFESEIALYHRPSLGSKSLIRVNTGHWQVEEGQTNLVGVGMGAKDFLVAMAGLRFTSRQPEGGD